MPFGKPVQWTAQLTYLYLGALVVLVLSAAYDYRPLMLFAVMGLLACATLSVSAVLTTQNGQMVLFLLYINFHTMLWMHQQWAEFPIQLMLILMAVFYILGGLLVIVEKPVLKRFERSPSSGWDFRVFTVSLLVMVAVTYPLYNWLLSLASTRV